jgi:hypothetical protein
MKKPKQKKQFEQRKKREENERRQTDRNTEKPGERERHRQTFFSATEVSFVFDSLINQSKKDRNKTKTTKE